ncbi:MAG: energy-coupling factor transporter transmembrane protein EcfT [Roseburia sp.]|nr:energy-coupling factor transporter transmembrane protein EcfT [Roseburia sp.]
MNYFSNFHPAVIFLYFIAVLVLNMAVFDPVLFLISFLGLLVFYLYLKGIGEGMGFVWKCLFVIPVCGGINMLINHRGVSVFFYMAGLPVTKECLFYGCMTGTLLALSFLLFGCWNHLMTSDRIMCLFGNRFPHVSLIFSMALRLVPKVRRDYRKIRENHKLQTGILTTLIGMSLEDSLETGIAMGYRGYGKNKMTGKKEMGAFRRTSIQSKPMGVREYLLLGVFFLLFLCGVGAYMASGTRLLVFPYIDYTVDRQGIAAYVLFGLLVNVPMLINIREELRWRHIISKI